MQLKIRANSSNPSAAPGEERVFEQFPVVIGRAPGCTLVLPDENKYVSSQHAQISLANGTLTLTDTSANGTYINKTSTPIGRGNSTPLSNGDVLSMGEFDLQITIETYQGSAPTPLDDPFGDIPAATPVAPIAGDPFGDIAAPGKPAATADDPFAGLEDVAAPGLSSLQSDEHIDRLEGIGIGPSAWETESDAIPQDPFDALDPTPTATPGGDFGGESFQQPAAPHPPTAAPPAAASDDDDWAGWIGSLPSADTPPAPQPAAQPAAHAAPPSAASLPTIANPNITAAAPVASGSDEALNALLRTAGLNPAEFSAIDRAALGTHIGGILKKSTQSMMLLLRSRDEIKNAMRADVTLLGAKGNSPLQFSLTAEDALKKLLTPSPTSGFSDANKAIDKGLQDIKIHQLAMLEAMRSALQIALSHFDPDTLQQRTRDSSPLASTIPLAREAKLWEQFQARYNDIKRETVDDFSDLFGKELRKAYEKSVNELKRNTE